MTKKLNKSSFIVMVDDNEVDFMAAKRYIGKSQIDKELLYFDSGVVFVKYLKQLLIDNASIDIPIVLMDVNMPGLNGHEIIKLIRDIPAYSDKPLIYMLTSSKDFRDKENAENSGADGFLEKPFSPEGYIDLFNSLAKIS